MAPLTLLNYFLLGVLAHGAGAKLAATLAGPHMETNIKPLKRSVPTQRRVGPVVNTSATRAGASCCGGGRVSELADAVSGDVDTLVLVAVTTTVSRPWVMALMVWSAGRASDTTGAEVIGMTSVLGVVTRGVALGCP